MPIISGTYAARRTPRTSAAVRTPTVGSPLVLRTAEDLRTLVHGRFPRTVPLVLELPGLEPEVAHVAAARLHAYRNECGCSIGAWFMSIGLAASLLWFLLRDGATAALVWQAPLAIGCGIACAGAGKAMALWRSRAKLRTEVTALVLHMQRGDTEV